MEVVMKKNLLLSFLLFGSIHQAKSMQFLKDIIRNSTIENTARNPTLKNLLFNAGLWYCYFVSMEAPLEHAETNQRLGTI